MVNMGKCHPLYEVVPWTALRQKPPWDKVHPDPEAGADLGKGHELAGRSTVITSSQCLAIVSPLMVKYQGREGCVKEKIQKFDLGLNYG